MLLRIALQALAIFPSALGASGQPRIVGGQPTTIDKVPYLVNLRQSGQFICGGSLITSHCVLTAAHCAYGVPASTLTVAAGASRLSDSAQMRQVRQSFVSPFYSPTTFDMDVAVLKLSEPMRARNITTLPLCKSHAPDGQWVRISGWGITSEGNRQPSDQVRTAHVRVVPRTDCSYAYGGKARISSSMFCATVPGEIDSCSGDSGGPVVNGGCVCGIVSWGFGCARSEYPGVYTDVANLRVNAFVKSVMMTNCM